jgi:hypothetical protein
MTATARREGTKVENQDPDDPAERLLRDVADIRIRAAGRDATMLKLGTALMPIGVVLAVVAWFLSRNASTPLDQNDALIVAIIGLSVSVVGGFVFLRYSLAEFLRFWMARLIHQQGTSHRTET